MKDFTKKIKAKGWKLKEIAERWGFSPRRMDQISANPEPLHLDAIEGLPSNLPGQADFTDFAEVIASKNIHDLTILLLVAAKKYGWTDDETRTLSKTMLDTMDYADMVKKHNRVMS
jgi:hypothetical protein